MARQTSDPRALAMRIQHQFISRLRKDAADKKAAAKTANQRLEAAREDLELIASDAEIEGDMHGELVIDTKTGAIKTYRSIGEQADAEMEAERARLAKEEARAARGRRDRSEPMGEPIDTGRKGPRGMSGKDRAAGEREED